MKPKMPKEYEVKIEFSGHTRVRVFAANKQDAEHAAFRQFNERGVCLGDLTHEAAAWIMELKT